jgi:hypothetical protein
MRWAGGESGGVAGSRRTRVASFAGGGGDEGRCIRARNRRVINRFLGSVLRALVVDDPYDALVVAGQTGSMSAAASGWSAIAGGGGKTQSR